MRKPSGTAGLGILTIVGAHVRAVGAYLKPLTQEMLVISCLKPNSSIYKISQRMSESLEKTIGKIT